MGQNSPQMLVQSPRITTFQLAAHHTAEFQDRHGKVFGVGLTAQKVDAESTDLARADAAEEECCRGGVNKQRSLMGVVLRHGDSGAERGNDVGRKWLDRRIHDCERGGRRSSRWKVRCRRGRAQLAGTSNRRISFARGSGCTWGCRRRSSCFELVIRNWRKARRGTQRRKRHGGTARQRWRAGIRSTRGDRRDRRKRLGGRAGRGSLS